MQKNTAGQKWRVFAFNRTSNVPTTGDAANITATISIDGAALTGTNDVNPTELADGFYEFNLTQAETNGDSLLLSPSSVTSDIQVVGCPACISTNPTSWGDDVIQTGDSFARIGVAGVGLTNIGDSRMANLAGAGSGARTVTITIDDGTNPLEAAKVRMTEGANTYILSTNASGVAVFNLDDATYTVAVTKAGYTYSGTTLVVDGVEAQTYSMTAVSITPPANPAMTTAYFVAYDINGSTLASETYTYQQVSAVSGTGLSFEPDSGTATSDVNGLVQISMYKGASYNVTRGSAEAVTVSIDAAAGSTTELSNML